MSLKKQLAGKNMAEFLKTRHIIPAINILPINPS